MNRINAESGTPHLKGKPSRQYWVAWLSGLALALLVLVSYWPSIKGGFVWDDLVLVKKNPLTTGELNLRNVWLAGDFSLTTVVTWLEWLVFGGNPLGYRLTNLVLHCVSAFLLWRFLTQLRVRGAWVAAALFAVHPVAVASVAWVSELKNTLSMPFFVASTWSFWTFLDSAQTGETGKQRFYYGLSLLTFLLALLAKTSTVMLPVILLAVIWWQKREVTKRNLAQLSPHFALALAFGLATIWFQSQQAIRGITVQSTDFLGRLAAAGQALWFYLSKALLPFNLSMIYPQWTEFEVKILALIPLFLWLTALTLLWRFQTGWRRPALVALGCFSALLLPVLGIVDMYFMIFSRVSDHFAYLALIPVTALVAAGITRLPDKRIAALCNTGLLGLFVFLAHARATAFASDEALWHDTLVKNPKAWSAHNNLACNLAERGNIDAAIKHFDLSLELNPGNAQAQRNLGKALTLKGRFAEAEPHFRSALKLKPDDVDALAAYASGLAENRRSTEAIEYLRKAISIRPDVQLRLQLAPILATSGNHAAAAIEMEKIIDSQSDSYEALNNLAWIRATCPDPSVRNGRAAVALAEKACRLSGSNQPITFATLAAGYAETGNFTNAANTAQIAIDLATANGNEQFATVNRQLQRLYLSGRPFHTPPIGQQRSSPR